MSTTDNSIKPPADRYCDLIMKGGITSGVVYPEAINQLSQQYRFKNIGGSSAGAMAAALTAAAEYQRRQTGSNAGFKLLADLPVQLGEDVPAAKSRRLLSLFQPQDGTHRLFAALVTTLNRGSTYGRIASIVWGLLKAYWPAALGGVIVGFGLGHASGLLTSLLVATLLVVIAVGVWIYRDVSGALVNNGFGLCNGMPGKDSKTAALTPWLHKLIQEAAGRTESEPPLTFGDLWCPPGETAVPEAPGENALVLKLFSSNLAHGRPYILPLEEQVGTSSPLELRANERFYFSPDELEPYLPKKGMYKWLLEHAQPYELEPGREGRDPDTAQAARLGLQKLPPPHAFPVLLAARMSLSFPLLFSAVPLWAIDHDSLPGQRKFRRCWFSDGGISSNFPMHLFDGLVPRWPTFGITLEPKIEGREDMVYLPSDYRKGYGERWNLFDGKPSGVGRFGGFIAAIVGTMQNWNDNTLSRMPGVRDRVARVRLRSTEGGMNLNMTSDNITEVAERGAVAADALLDRFSTEPSPGTQAAGWDEHRLVRLNVLLKMLETRAGRVEETLSTAHAHATPIDLLIEAALAEPVAAGYDQVLSPEQAKTLRDLVEALSTLMNSFDTAASGPQPNPFVPLPKPELRVRPPL